MTVSWRGTERGIVRWLCSIVEMTERNVDSWSSETEPESCPRRRNSKYVGILRLCAFTLRRSVEVMMKQSGSLPLLFSRFLRIFLSLCRRWVHESLLPTCFTMLGKRPTRHTQHKFFRYWVVIFLFYEYNVLFLWTKQKTAEHGIYLPWLLLWLLCSLAAKPVHYISGVGIEPALMM